MSRTVVVSSDHTAFDEKDRIIEFIKTLPNVGEVIDMCPTTPASVDYPVFAEKGAQLVASGKADVGVIMCGTGIGVSIVSNKVNGVRAALCHDHYTAEKAREHNNANVVCFGVRVVGMEVIKDIVQTFLATPFEIGSRHDRRVSMITEVEHHNVAHPEPEQKA